MTKLSYNVVFEYTPEAGGFYGTRTWTSYSSEANFKKNYHPEPLTKVLKAGVSQEEAIIITTLTPEICRLTAGIEDAYGAENSRNPFPSELFDFYILSPLMAIDHDRKFIREHQLVREPATIILDYWKSQKDDSSVKYGTLRSAWKNANKYGQVDLDIFKADLVSAMFARQTPWP